MQEVASKGERVLALALQPLDPAVWPTNTSRDAFKVTGPDHHQQPTMPWPAWLLSLLGVRLLSRIAASHDGWMWCQEREESLPRAGYTFIGLVSLVDPPKPVGREREGRAAGREGGTGYMMAADSLLLLLVGDVIQGVADAVLRCKEAGVKVREGAQGSSTRHRAGGQVGCVLVGLG